MLSVVSYLLFEDVETGESEGITLDKEKLQEIQTAIIDLFTEKNFEPDDDDIHALAAKFKLDPHEFEEILYALFGEYIQGVGKHKDVPDTKFNSKQLKMGEKVETEHTDAPGIKRQIAKDHLAEIPDYYTRLNKMEKEARRRKKND